MGIDYNEYIANNISQFGCAIFDSLEYPSFDFENLKKDLQSRDNAFYSIYIFPLNVYSNKDKTLHTYWTVVNESELSPFIFFDMVRMACGSLHLSKFYACDFQTDKIYEMGPASICEFGNLSDLRTLLKLDDDNYIVGKWMKWCGPPGYSRYYSEAKVFRNDVEKEYFGKYGKFLSQYSQQKLEVDTFYSLDECKNKFNQKTNCLKFENITALEFDIDDPNLTIEAISLKSKNLNIYRIDAKKELFCENLKCKSINSPDIYAESIECENLNAEKVKTNFKNGITFKESFKKELE